MAITSIFNKLQNLIPHNTSPKPAPDLVNYEFEFTTFSKQTTNQEENAEFLAKLDNLINEGNIISARCNKKIEEARIKYPFLQTPSQVYQPSGEFHHLVSWYEDNANNSDLSPSYDEVINEINNLPPSYDKAVGDINNIPKSKSFFASFSSPLKTVYDFGSNSFSEIKKKAETTYATIKESIKPVANKVYNLGLKFSLLLKKTPHDPVEEILNTPENKLDAIFENMTYKKLAELINNVPHEKAQELVSYIMPCHLEKLMKFIPLDKLSTYINNTISLEELTKQGLKKLSNKDISDAQIKDIIILAGEEKLVKSITTSSNAIPNKNLEIIFNNISTKGGIEILSSLCIDEDLPIELSGAAAAA